MRVCLQELFSNPTLLASTVCVMSWQCWIFDQKLWFWSFFVCVMSEFEQDKFFFFCAFAITFFFLDYILGNYAPDHILPGLFFWKIFKNKLTWGLASCWILQNFMIDIVYWKLCACSHCAWPVILDNFQNQADIWAFFSVNPAKQVLRHSSFPRHMSVLTWALISFW